MERSRYGREGVKLLLLAGVYFVLAKLGLKLAFENPSATAVWPPTAIALTAFLWWGSRVWPAIFVGAFLVNLLTAGSLATSLAIASGNTLEGLVAAYLVQRFANGLHAFDRTFDIFKFAGLAGLISTAVSPAIGVTALALGGYAPWSHYGAIWTTWWLGDAGGALLLAPFLILWSVYPPRLPLKSSRVIEAGLLLMVLLSVDFLVFGGIPKNTIPAILCVPPILWIAFRRGRRETATANLIFAIIATWGTLHGYGPFARGTTLNVALVILQIYLGVVSMIGLVVAAVVSERQRAEASLREVNEELERRVQERTASLAKTVNTLQAETTERRKAEEKVRLFADIVQNMQIGVGVVRLEDSNDEKSLRIVATNPGASRMTGLPPGSTVGKTVWDAFPDLYKTALPHLIAEVIRSGKPRDVGEIRYQDQRIPEGVFSMKIFPLPDRCAGVAFENVTEKKRMEYALRASEDRFRRIVESNIIGFLIVDTEGKILEANDTFLKALGYTPNYLQGQSLRMSDITPPEYLHVEEWVLARINASGYCPPLEKEFIRRDGTRWPVLIGAVRLNEPQPHSVCFVVDVTERRRALLALEKSYTELETRVTERTSALSKANAELEKEVLRRKKAESKLRNLSLKDVLTGLYNRRGFLALAEQQFLLARRDKKEFSLFFADIDGLKQINDALGHPRGDQALLEVANVLRDTFRKSDILARMGGDEFAVATTKAIGSDHREAYVARVRERLQRVNTHAHFPFLLSLSIGVVVFEPRKMSTLQELMVHADKNLYRYKRSHHDFGVNVIRAGNGRVA